MGVELKQNRLPANQTGTATSTYNPWRIRLQLTKPLTWVGPAWSVACGVVGASGADFSVHTFGYALLLIVLIGPLVLGMGQSINDYCDADVDAINEPDRPCAKVPEFKHLAMTNVYVLTLASLIVAYTMFRIEIFWLVVFGLVTAYIYSAPPLRLKQNGWYGNTACAITYVTIPWIAGNLAFDSFTWQQATVASIYAIGSHGMMTFNDFKSVKGDTMAGLKSIVVQYGIDGGLKLALAMLNTSQLLAALFLAWQGRYVGAVILIVFLLIQLPFQKKVKEDPVTKAPWYNATAGSFFILGMMVAAFYLK
ncbi:(bacterio)chlorophyll synthase [Heliophilum fasciatum]|uniref:Chlorophyll synthase n=1 Tax=Heliophilum fasciatum TaxID=35700 RepID=A0A4V2SY26_9FIRM|nr:(bacterio)chlorophyll synthase [Heliophilum fasciatum]MCW2277048.1 chlorophyll synthase [Heliophilum fasciatum]TCP68426.1 chlorophyll synthase [Heliophilum fasciatum]